MDESGVPDEATPAATRPGAVEAALDVLLFDGGLWTTSQRFLPGADLARVGVSLARHPSRTLGRGLRWATQMGRVATGAATLAPAKGDRRFTDSAWTDNGVFRRVMQAYLATGHAVDGLITDAGRSVDDEARVRFAVDNVLDALSPTNFLITNPAALKETVNSRGANLVRGARNFVKDMSSSPRLPASADPDDFTVGVDVAATPGAVVLRTPTLELIQYTPQTTKVRSVPLLLVPAFVNRYYLVDLAPGRSLVEYLLAQGQQVFVISWRNPDERHRDWTLDTYAQGVLDALDATCAITRSDRAHLGGTCSGGMLTSSVAAHLAVIGEGHRVAGMMMGVCVLDTRGAGTTSSFTSRDAAAAAVAASSRKGYLDGRTLQTMFAWLRPNDLIWSYVVNNYLLGKPPPAFDILHWNADTTRMAAGLHRDLTLLALDNSLVQPGKLEVLGTPVDLGKVEADGYVAAGVSDHITPWQSCYRTTQLMGGHSRFVLSTSGHVAALVNPPGNPKARFHTSDGDTPADPEAWLATATERSGTWWADWDAWLSERSGTLRQAPRRLGNRNHPATDPAPGRYVHD